MKKVENFQIVADACKAGLISERAILLLKRRSNESRADVCEACGLYDNAAFEDAGGLSLTAEQGAKGLAWLKRLLKKDGTPRNNSGLGYREAEIIKSATPEDFLFCGFYDCGRYGFHNFTPLYDVLGMEYYNDGGKIQVVG